VTLALAPEVGLSCAATSFVLIPPPATPIERLFDPTEPPSTGRAGRLGGVDVAEPVTVPLDDVP